LFTSEGEKQETKERVYGCGSISLHQRV